MNNLIDMAVDHARTVIMILVLLLVSGVVTYIDIPKEADPDVDIPVLVTRVILDGISPEDADRMLVAPLERELEVIEGVRNVHSVAFEGGARVTLEFDAGFNAEVAGADVREAVDRAATGLPDEADDPVVEEINISQFPQVVIGLGGPVPERALYGVAEQLKKALEALPSVLEVVINGKRKEMVEIVVDPHSLESYNITQQDLANAVTRNNELVAAGILDSGVGRFALKVPGVIETSDEILNLPLKSVGGRVVRMRDIAQVRRVYMDATNIARVDGQSSVTMEIRKRSGSNVIDTIDQVRAVVATHQEDWPESLSVNYFGDRSVEIRDMLRDLENNVLIAVLLVVMVVVATLGLRSASLVAVAIPGSFVIGMLVVSGLGLTVNIVVLFSLIMAVGIVVDGAIVVTEYADRQMLGQQTRVQAYKLAARQMAMPIIASTATTLAAFLPLLFWPGVVGEFMKYLPITLIATLSASLLMALFFVPTLGGLIGKPGVLANRTLAEFENGQRTRLETLPGVTGAYARFLGWAIRFPGSILLMVCVFLLAIGVAYNRMGHGTEFFPDVEPQQAVISMLARGDLSVRERDDILRNVEKHILEIPEVRMVYATTDLNEQDQVASITLEFKDWDQRSRRVDEVLLEVRELEAVLPGVRLEVQKMNAGPGGDRKPIQLAFTSTNLQESQETLALVRRWMEDHGGFTDIEDSLPQPGLEWNIIVDREQAGRFGADITLVGTFIQLVTNGVKLSTYRPDDTSEELEIRVRFPADYRQLAQVQDLRISTINGYVPLSNFATLQPEQKVSVLERLKGKPVFRLKAAPLLLSGENSVNDGQLVNTRLNQLHAAVEEMGLSTSVDVIFEGQDEDQQESMLFLLKAMGVALFIMAIILVTQFNSFYQAGLVLTAVIFSLGGVFLGLLLMGEAFGVIMSGVGVISLAGIVVNNNIVLIDTFNTLTKQGYPVYEAVVRTGVQRFRPVFLTTVTTILGLLPMVFKINLDLFGRSISFGSPSTQWWSQLATAVAGGLAFATILTLIVTPCLLALPTVYRARKRVKILKKRLTSGRSLTPDPVQSSSVGQS